jgi:hypothetical protein
MRKVFFGVSSLVLGLFITFATSSAGTSEGRGRWVNVTPAGVDLVSKLDCDNFGSLTMVADPARPSDLYTQFNCQGVWKSIDFGRTWTGPINTGQGGVGAKGAGALAIARGPDGQPPILYSAGIRGSGLGFWKSTDGGVGWTRYRVAPSRDRQDFYAPAVDPYDPDHLIMAGHHMSMIVRSEDGGRTWTEVSMDPGMKQGGGTGAVFFINKGHPTTTARTWLWSAEGTGGKIGTWRTSDAGGTWAKVDSNEHPHGQMQIYQPDTSGVMYMPGLYSTQGNGVLRSTDFGETWKSVGLPMFEAVVFGTPKRIYAMWAWACGGCNLDPALQSAPNPGISGWARMPTPPEMAIGPAQVATVFDGTNYIILTANWTAGLWRFVE